jgi:hypothetical protein
MAKTQRAAYATFVLHRAKPAIGHERSGSSTPERLLCPIVSQTTTTMQRRPKRDIPALPETCLSAIDKKT